MTHARPLADLRAVRLFLLDMDGTFYLGDRLLERSLECIETFRATGREFLFLTNNSSKNKRIYAEKIRKMGLEIGDDAVFSSGEATAIYLSDRHPGARLYVVGTPALEEEFTAAGFVLDDRDPEIVVLGFDTTLTYDKIWKLCDFVRAGKPYIATHPDFNCPIEGGWMPDVGGMIAMVEACTGQRPTVIGKPNAAIIEALEKRTRIARSEIAMVGDRLYTDIALGANAGILSVLVLSGETTAEDLTTSEIRPDFVFSNLGGIADVLNGSAERPSH
ncbi:MAG: HAD-IIA family hydrolase [Clostridiaceae bacterium]|jgi:HAD superfamily hydrolase (TIGR01457 family)|nr:HAD-IIA family hydrolase [Clostridiaceae bacterium]